MGGFKNISSNPGAALVYITVLLLTGFATIVNLKFGPVVGMAIYLLPAALLMLLFFIERPFMAFLTLFTINYLISGLSRYIPSLAPGIFMDMILLLVILIVILQLFRKENPLSFKNSLHALTLLSFIWFVYCVLQVFNPNSSSIVAWATSVRGVGMYFFILVLLTSLFVTKYKHLRTLLILWALLSI